MSSDEAQEPGRPAPAQRPGPPGGARARNRARRIAALEEAGLRLFLDKGIEGTRVEDLAREAGMAKGGYYRYFRDRADLVRAILAPVDAGLRAALEGCATELAAAEDLPAAEEAYAGLAGAVGALFFAHAGAVRLYLQEARAPATPDRAAVVDLAHAVDAAARRLSHLGVERGLLRIADPDVTAVAIVGGIEALALAALQGRLAASPADAAEILTSLVLRGVGVGGRAT
jgi:AcrR family transcriptional regulator